MRSKVGYGFPVPSDRFRGKVGCRFLMQIKLRRRVRDWFPGQTEIQVLATWDTSLKAVWNTCVEAEWKTGV